MTSAPRVLLIGLDGATFDLLDPLMVRGFMPHLQRLVARGVRGKLRSTDPYVTAPAWSSLVTGTRPDVHGIFDWSAREPGRYRRRLLDARARRVPTFWELLADRGIPAGALNLPLSYPPTSRASFLVADMFTPSLDVAFTHPPALKQDLLMLAYQLDVHKRDYFRQGFRPFVQALTQSVRTRGEALRLCLERYPWRAAIGVFTETDRLQHAFWEHLQFEGAWNPDTLEAAYFYQTLDVELGRLLELVGEDTAVHVVSDHGFGAHRGAFYINTWLEAQGYLVLKRESRPEQMLRRMARGGLSRGRGLLQERLRGLGRPGEPFAKRLDQHLNGLEQGLGDGLTPDAPTVDWSKTVAFADTPHGIQLNVLGREPQGVVAPERYASLRQTLAQALEQVTDPRSGQRLHAQVLPREARFTGPQAGGAPDLVYTFADEGYSWRIGRPEHLKQGRLLEGLPLAVETLWETGTHRSEGILISAGPGIRAGGRLEGAHLWDVLPTLLYQLGEGCPSHVDGRVLEGLFEESHRQRHPVMPMTSQHEGLTPSPSATWGLLPDEEALVAERLRALGYLG